MGSHASGLTGFRSATIGAAMSERKRKRPIMNPIGMPTAAASPKPIATRPSDISTFQPMPWSLGPLR
jgi:hypothetical protein